MVFLMRTSDRFRLRLKLGGKFSRHPTVHRNGLMSGEYNLPMVVLPIMYLALT